MPHSSQVKRQPSDGLHTPDALNVAGQPNSLLARKQQLVRSAILDAAIDLFAEKGFDQTTVEEIAQAAGVSRRSFFRYFSSKNDLMGENMVLYANALREAVAAFPRTYSPFEVIRDTVLQVARAAAATPRARKIMQIAAVSPAAREAQLSRRAEVEDCVAEAFAQRSRKRSKDNMTPRVLAGVTMLLVDVTLRSWFESERQDVSAAAARALATLHGVFGEERASGRK